MKFIYAGRYNGDPASLPQREEPDGVQFREFENLRTFGIIMNILAGLVWILMTVLLSLYAGELQLSVVGALLSLTTMLPHEFLHAVCFWGEVRMYQNLKDGMLFVVGTESMSKARFVFMSMLPNLVFGFLPLLIFLVFPQIPVVGTFGILGVCMGAGDYVNVYNCLVQVPKGAKVYMSGIHSYWLPAEKTV